MHRLGAFALIALAVAACAGTPLPTASPAPSSPAPSPSPTPGAAAVVRIYQSGGMLPRWETINWYPSAVLYADGRLITQGPMIEIYPGPALPNLQVTQLSPQGIAQVLQAALDSGFLGPDRDLGEQMLDSGSTVITITTAEGTHTTRLHGPTSDPEVVAALRFQEAILSPREWFPGAVMGDDRPYAWDRLQVVAQPMTAAELPDPAMASEVDWPLATLATLGFAIEPGQQYRCAVIEGPDVDLLRPLLANANELTLWASDGATFQLDLHPLLPDDEGCQAPPA